ncbi:PREDICTED: uncharacterized protein LOC105461517, partial [Wasmannia auropunctata]|uniref:uncharacterized protein LOC105461517 n=1 Tax=Wasmannia auropunctata TaxID=64793 RepID=UPI0005EFDFF7
MRFITAIVIIALSDAAVSSPDFGDRITRVKSSNANSVRQQSDPNEYLSLFNIHQQLEKLQSILRDSQQKNEMNYTLQPSSLTDTPLNISFSASEHSLSIPHSTPQSTSQQSSLYVPQSFNGSTFYNPQSNQLTFPILLPLNCSES